MIDSAGNGATVTFDYIKFINIKGITKEIDKIPYHFNKPKDSIPFKSEAVQEVHKLRSFSFISGTVYFADCSFPNVLSVKASDTLVFYWYYVRSGPETTITLDNCIFKNAGGVLPNPISKSIKLKYGC